MNRRLFCIVALLAMTLAGVARGADLEARPAETTVVDNPISRLAQRIESNQTRLVYDSKSGWLPSILQSLDVPKSSQMLVFSKTSFQRHRIGPQTPRAIYFNDDIYVGFCPTGDVLEVSTTDPQLGPVFYTVEQKQAVRPRFTRQSDACLICHASSQNQNLPGHLARSVYADADGLPLLSMGSHYVDQSSPLSERWGGWYVTGSSGKQTHLGNLIVAGEREPEQIVNSRGVNVTSLAGRFDTSPYLSGQSDIVALMVLEHQVEGQNRIARANLLTRTALHDEAALNKELGEPAHHHWDSTTSRIKSAGEPLVKYLLMNGAAPLTDPVRGASGFAEDFSKPGPRDPRGRSLRDLDLKRRLFKYPCSFLIYSSPFEALPVPVKDYVLRRIWEVVTGKDTSADFAHISLADRNAILEILRATRPTLPEYWQVPIAKAR